MLPQMENDKPHFAINSEEGNMPKLKHQFNNLRHIQHHVGQLVDRVRDGCDVGGKGIIVNEI